jgi:hypothetical protein
MSETYVFKLSSVPLDQALAAPVLHPPTPRTMPVQIPLLNAFMLAGIIEVIRLL